MTRLLAILTALPLMAVAAAPEITATRTTAYDWQCQTDAGVQVSNHAREGTAITACANRALADGKTYYVQGGRYRVTSTTTVPNPPPPPAVGTAALSWTAPTKNTDGSTLTNLAGYRVYHGTSANALNEVIPVTGLTYTFTALASGTHYFAVAAYNTAGVESVLSAVGSKVIP